MNSFSIPEIIILLALNEEKGSTRFLASLNMDIAIAGAILAEMRMQRIIEIEAKKIVLKQDNYDDPVIKKVMEMMHEKAKNKSLAHWLDKISSKGSRFKKLYLQRLCDRGILRKEANKILGLIPITYYPLRDPSKKRQIEISVGDYAIKQVISDERINLILVLLNAIGMTGYVLDKHQRKQIGSQLNDLIKKDMLGKEIKNAISRRVAVTGGV